VKPTEFRCTDCGKTKNRKKERAGWSETDKTSPTGWVTYHDVCVDCWVIREDIRVADQKAAGARAPKPEVRAIDPDAPEVVKAAALLEAAPAPKGARR
jgi:hypothetical protein